MRETITLPGAQAHAFILETGERVRIVNLEGSQVVDAWAFRSENFERIPAAS